MGMEATLLAVGKYSVAVRSYLDYPPECYENTPVGATILAIVGSCQGTHSSKLLASALHIDPWNFQQHCNMSGIGANISMLAEAFGDAGTVADFIALRACGFKFFFMPNG